MNWIRLQSEYFRHRKTLRLARRLGESAPQYPIRLWLWAVEQSPDGSLRDISPEELAVICAAKVDPAELWAAMVDCGFVEIIDGEAWIRSWYEHQGKLIERAERNADRMQRARSKGAQDASVAPAETEAPTTIAPDSPALLTFPTDGKSKSWTLTEAHVAEWSTLYPKLDVLDECRQALAWVLAAPDRRKTAAGMARFLVGWLNRSTNSARRSAAPRDFAADKEERQRAALKAGGKTEAVSEIPMALRLSDLAATLPDDLPGVGRWRREIVALTGDAESVESVLAGMDVRMLAALKDEIGAESLADMDAKVRAGLARMRARGGTEDAATVSDRLWSQLIRQRFGAPVLSLFSASRWAA